MLACLLSTQSTVWSKQLASFAERIFVITLLNLEHIISHNKFFLNGLPISSQQMSFFQLRKYFLRFNHLPETLTTFHMVYLSC